MKIRLILTTLASAVFFSMALPNELLPYGSWLLGLFALIPYLATLSLSPSYRFSVILGLVYGSVTAITSNYWLMFFQEFSLWTLGGTVLGYALYNMVLAAYLHHVTRGTGRIIQTLRPFLIAAVWTGYEYLKSSGFLGYPWGLAGYPFHSILPLIQFIDITGIWGLSFVIVLFNATINELLIERYSFIPYIAGEKKVTWRDRVSTRYLAFTLIIVSAILIYGSFKMSLPPAKGKSFHFILIQQNTDPWIEGGGKRSILTNERLTEEALAKTRDKPDLVVWSESSLVYPAVRYSNYYEKFPKEKPLLPFIRRRGISLLTGAPVLIIDKDKGKDAWNYMQAMNAVVLYNRRGRVVTYYGKQHPVPFAESIPFWDVPWVRELFRKYIGIQNVWVMGKKAVIFPITLKDGSPLKFATPICFEDAFPYINRDFANRGAEVFINLTNDAWSRTVSSETQHFIAAKFRSVETRRYLLRSTVAGVTSIVDPFGKVTASLPLFKEGYLEGKIEIPETSPTTIYMLLGDFFPISLLILIFILIFLDFLQSQSRYRRHGNRDRRGP